ncbi:HAD-IA family hydrolase [Gilliamella intestini]|uniref:Haloacid dehalogenase superfamily, subfamily IA, variant 1 with third motif having Dx(3-4)D or Dx(3-4)E n=1 Tax=Gilliamella intestini TaxID=1798183 RepID=A0A1C3ZD26_9GAMM|nr:HAD-IA family hydrolase [Gilliamella intestini]SCB80261.1 haloacid dehalogenase superfamily, subfamily IA, variant 1 with third motif having Dx(3-4)D or Dx(3-4)E [Gilliamella intestini]
MKTDIINLLSSTRNYFFQNAKTYDDTYIERVLKDIECYEVISFDIFDTILTRLVECPIDVFSIVEKCLIEKGHFCASFAVARFESEKIARDIAYQQNIEEVTLDNIYEQLKITYPEYQDVIEEAKQTEMMIEINYCVPSLDNLFLINKIFEKNKKIILVSDMYLDEETIKKMLSKVGVSSFDKLYLSSNLLKTKNHGTIWQNVLDDYANQKILHIGDNYYSDVEVPKRDGIDTIWYNSLITERRLGGQLSTNIIPFSLIKKMILLTDKVIYKDFWFVFGISCGSFFIYSFLQWLNDHVRKNKIEHVYFCSRDAQIIYNLWKEFNFDKLCGVTSSYLYISRLVLGYSQCYIECQKHNKLSEASLTFLSNHNIVEGQTNRDVLTRLKINISDIDVNNFVNKFGDLDSKFKFSLLDDFKFYLGHDLLPLLLPQFEEQYKNSYQYYDQEGIFSSKKIAIVDLGWSGTLQQALTLFRENHGIKEKISGFYYGLHNGLATGRIFYNGLMDAAFFSEFNDPNKIFLMKNSINILENLHVADHESVIGFTESMGKYIPIFKEKKDNLKEQVVNLKRFYKGLHSVISKWVKNEDVFGINSDYINVNTAKGALAQVICSPTSLEVKELGNILHAPGYDHEIYFPLIWSNEEPWDEKIYPMIHRGGWLCGQLLYWKYNGYYSDNAHLYQIVSNELSNYPTILKNFILG